MTKLPNRSQPGETFRENSSGDQPTDAQRLRWANQEKIVFATFFHSPKTMYMVEKETGVMRANICRFVATWKRQGTIRVVKTDRDPHTGCRAQFLTTNRMYWPRPEPVRADRSGQTYMF